MIRLKAFVLIVSSIAGSVQAGAADTGKHGENPEITWSARTNDWPSHLWTYEIAPQEFPPAIISNLLSLSGFTEHDRTSKMIFRPPIDRKSAQYFKSTGDSKYLAIFPSEGWTDYHDAKAEAVMGQPVEGVPDEHEARNLALQYLRALGIDRDHLAVRPGTSEIDTYGAKGTRTYHDKATGKEVTAHDFRGVYFARRIDGVPIEGIGLDGGVHISFGNNSRIIDLQVVWRALSPVELWTTMPPGDVLQKLRNGEINLPSFPGLHAPPTINITKADFFYEGRYGDETQKRVSPYLRLTVTAEISGKPTLYLRCPVTAGPWKIKERAEPSD